MKDFQKKLFIRLGLAVVISGVLFGTAFFVGSDIESVHDSIRSMKNVFATKAQMTSSLAELRQTREEAESAMSILRNALPDRESLFIFTNEVSRIAQTRGLTAVSSFGSEIPGSESAPGRIEFTINISGEYDKIVEFIKEVETSRYFTSVKSFDFVSQGANTSGYQAIITADIFYKSL
ncbi:MAG: type 4a pilus biogenesis protein PilO [Candidatus Colwellbacteria bacterium]|nr:type 4a pilus biogenesis protein PilO [Candidatus Colwellbacteria bacterium]